MATLSRLTTWSSGDVLTASALNAEFNNIVNDYNGGIVNANISATAAIAYSKLALTGAILNADLAGSIASSKISGTAVTLDGVETLTNKTLTNPVLTKPTVNGSIPTLTTSTYDSTVTFNLSSSNHFILTLSGNPTLAVSNASVGQAFIIHIKQGAGSNAVIWWSGIQWAGGSAPTQTSTAAKVDTFGFICASSGVYYGYIIGQNI